MRVDYPVAGYDRRRDRQTAELLNADHRTHVIVVEHDMTFPCRPRRQVHCCTKARCFAEGTMRPGLRELAG